jgi:hypothetical protein
MQLLSFIVQFRCSKFSQRNGSIRLMDAVLAREGSVLSFDTVFRAVIELFRDVSRGYFHSRLFKMIML